MVASKWSRISQYRKVFRFIGRTATVYLGLGVLTGLCQFAVELLFAYLLRGFLIQLQIMPGSLDELPGWVPTQSLTSFLLFLASAIFLRGAIQWVHSYLTSAASEIQRDHQRYRLVEWALRSPSVSSSLTMNLFSEGTFAISQVLSNLQNISVLVSTGGLLWLFLLKMSPLTTLVATAVLFTVGFLTKFLDRPIRQEGVRVTEELEQVNVLLINSIKNLLLIQIYGTQNREREKIKSRLSQVLRSLLRYQKMVYLKGVIPQTLGLVVICGISAVAIREQWLSPALAVGYFYLFLRFVQSFADAVRASSTAVFYMPNTVRLAEWWAEHSFDGVRNPTNEKTALPPPPFEKSMGWNIRNLSYRYPNALENVVQNLSFEIKPGQVTVMTGDSGSGKSTLIGLLLGNLKPTEGQIELCHSQGSVGDLALHRDQLLQSVGYVGAESFLIEGTLRDNLSYGLSRPPTEEQIQRALRLAECQFVDQFAAGLNHRLTEQGAGLSAGQKQRLGLARALLRQPRVLILDEATANLDAQTEARLVQTLAGLRGEVTLFAVTHREALLKIADLRLHLKAGRLSQEVGLPSESPTPL